MEDSVLKILKTDVFVTAREIGEKLDITSQKASGLLRRLENQSKVGSKKVKAGINEVKCYYLNREERV